MRDDDRTGDSGTNRLTKSTAIATPIAPTTNSQRQLRWSTITPESTSPSPPPTPNTAESSPMPTFIRSGGNSSRMIPKLRGNTAPPAPETMPEGDQRPDVGSERAADAACEEDRERDDEQPLLAEAVAELAQDRRETPPPRAGSPSSPT